MQFKSSCKAEKQAQRALQNTLFFKRIEGTCVLQHNLPVVFQKKRYRFPNVSCITSTFSIISQLNSIWANQPQSLKQLSFNESVLSQLNHAWREALTDHNICPVLIRSTVGCLNLRQKPEIYYFQTSFNSYCYKVLNCKLH